MAGKKPTVMHGARAILAIAGQPVGIFTNVSYQVQLDVAPVTILGSYAPVTTEYVGMEPVSVSATGWRVLDHGPHAVIGKNGERIVPALAELISADELSITVYDRQDPTKKIADITNVRSQGFSSGVAARSLSELTVTFIGLIYSDESLPDNGEPGAATLPA